MADWFADGAWRLTTRMGEEISFFRPSAVPPKAGATRIPLPARRLRRELERGLLGFDPWARARLCQMLQTLQGHDPFWGYAPTEAELRKDVLPRLVEALESGALIAFREERPRPHPVPGIEPPDEQPEPPDEDELTWIAVQLMDTSGNVIAGARYELELTDGSVVRGRSDREGMVRVEGLEPGNCKLRLPDFEMPESDHPDETAPEQAAAPEEQTVADEDATTPTILEAHVKDRAGKPIANRAFRATFDDGSVREGTTDGEGLVRLEDCPPGECKLVFEAPPSS